MIRRNFFSTIIGALFGAKASKAIWAKEDVINAAIQHVESTVSPLPRLEVVETQRFFLGRRIINIRTDLVEIPFSSWDPMPFRRHEPTGYYFVQYEDGTEDGPFNQAELQRIYEYSTMRVIARKV